MHAVAALLAAEHLNDLLREAEEDRRRARVRAATQTTSPGRFAGLLHRLPAVGRRGSAAARPTDRRPATA